SMRQCCPAFLADLARRARDRRALPYSRAGAQVVPAASYVVAPVSPPPSHVTLRVDRWTSDPNEIAEQTLVGDFNRNNKMSLKKHILFSRPRPITFMHPGVSEAELPARRVTGRVNRMAPVRRAAPGEASAGTGRCTYR